MKVHIENLNINIHPSRQMPPPLLALLAMAQASAPAQADEAATPVAQSATAEAESQPRTDIPAIGEKWPGTEALYAGVSLSMTGDRMVHLLLWPGGLKEATFEAAMEWAVKVNPDMDSHAPTRHQALTLFNNLRDQFNPNPWYWTMEKTKSGDAACVQTFLYGDQHYHNIDTGWPVRAVSEIPL